MKHLFPRIQREHGLDTSSIRISPKAIQSIIRDYTREAGVRELDRKLSTVCRKVVRRIVQEEDTGTPANIPISVGVADLAEHLGAPRRYDVSIPKERQQGTVVGLAWTEAGGDVLVIEAVKMKGKGDVTLTGNLGSIMQESAQAAIGFLRSKADTLGLSEFDWKASDIHIHVPEGAIPKDGPSAGVTMAVAILSAVSGRNILPNVAMTGEISLQGRVLPVGGIREKILAARRQGITTVILPEPNKPDFDEIPEWGKKDIEIRYVSSIAEVFQLALEE